MTQQLPPCTAFAVVDTERHIANAQYNRVIHDHFGYVEGYVEKHDDWTALPVRLTHTTAAGWQIELGPYDLNAWAIDKLRAAIAAYDQAIGR